MSKFIAFAPTLWIEAKKAASVVIATALNLKGPRSLNASPCAASEQKSRIKMT